MTIISQDRRAFHTRSPAASPGRRASTPRFVVVGLVSLLGLSLSALALASGAAADLETIVPFLG